MFISASKQLTGLENCLSALFWRCKESV